MISLYIKDLNIYELKYLKGILELLQWVLNNSNIFTIYSIF